MFLFPFFFSLFFFSFCFLFGGLNCSSWTSLRRTALRRTVQNFVLVFPSPAPIFLPLSGGEREKGENLGGPAEGGPAEGRGSGEGESGAGRSGRLHWAQIGNRTRIGPKTKDQKMKMGQKYRWANVEMCQSRPQPAVWGRPCGWWRSKVGSGPRWERSRLTRNICPKPQGTKIGQSRICPKCSERQTLTTRDGSDSIRAERRTSFC